MLKNQLFGKTLDELREIVQDLSMPEFTASQIADWLYKKRISSIDELSNISIANRKKLTKDFVIGVSKPSKVQVSVDGTKKYLYPASGNQYIESAYIPESNRHTLCISSQVGCKMGCLFCMTGKQGFQSNLSAGEIVNQIQSLPEFEKLTNVVYMGMGEPFDNLDNVLKSIEILTADWGYGWSPRRITVSTIGIIPAMKTFLEKSNAHLAISLHTPFDEEREKLMPVQTVYPIQKVVEELRQLDLGRQRRISFEYIMFKDLNDSAAHIKELLRLLNRVRCRINLIRFHPIPDTPLKGTDDRRIIEFRDELTRKGITTTIRASRGEDIFAACGLLSTKELVKRDEDEDF